MENIVHRYKFIIDRLERLKFDIQKNMRGINHNGEFIVIDASGETSKSLQVKVYDGGVKLISTGKVFFPTVELGAPSEPVSPEQIFQWTKQKKLNRSFKWAKAIAAKISRQGYSRPWSEADGRGYGVTNLEGEVYGNLTKAAANEIREMAKDKIKNIIIPKYFE